MHSINLLAQGYEGKIFLVNLFDSSRSGLLSEATLSAYLDKACKKIDEKRKPYKGKPPQNICLAAATKAMETMLFSDRTPAPANDDVYTVTKLNVIRVNHIDDDSLALSMLAPPSGIPNDSEQDETRRTIRYVESIAHRARNQPSTIGLKSGASLRSELRTFWMSSEHIDINRVTDDDRSFLSSSRTIRDWFGLIHRKRNDFLCRYRLPGNTLKTMRPTQIEGGGKRFAVRAHPTVATWGHAVDLASLGSPSRALNKIGGGTEAVCEEVALTHTLLGTLEPLGYPGDGDAGDTPSDDNSYLKLLLGGRGFDKDILAPLIALSPVSSPAKKIIGSTKTKP